MSDQQPIDDGFEWAVVEVFGHRQHIGKCREVERFGSKQLRVDELQLSSNTDATERWETIFYGGAAIFSYRPITEELARKTCARYYPAPARITSRFEEAIAEADRIWPSDDENADEV